MHIPIKPKQTPWVQWESFLWKGASSVPSSASALQPFQVCSWSKQGHNDILPLMKEMFLFHSSFLGNRWVGFVQTFNILTKIPLKSPLKSVGLIGLSFKQFLETGGQNPKIFQTMSVHLWESYMETTKYSKISLLLLVQKESKRNKGKKLAQTHSSGIIGPSISGCAGKRHTGIPERRVQVKHHQPSPQLQRTTPSCPWLKARLTQEPEQGTPHSVMPRQCLTLKCSDSNLPTPDSSRTQDRRAFVLLLTKNQRQHQNPTSQNRFYHAFLLIANLNQVFSISLRSEGTAERILVKWESHIMHALRCSFLCESKITESSLNKSQHASCPEMGFLLQTQTP